MKLNRSSSCIHVFFFFLSLFLFFSFAHCMYACICVHACVRVESLAILFSRVVFPRRVVRRDTASTFLFLRCLFSPFATAHLFITVFSIFSISLLSQQCLRVCVYICVCVCAACVRVYGICAYICICLCVYVCVYFFLFIILLYLSRNYLRANRCEPTKQTILSTLGYISRDRPWFVPFSFRFYILFAILFLFVKILLQTISKWFLE